MQTAISRERLCPRHFVFAHGITQPDREIVLSEVEFCFFRLDALLKGPYLYVWRRMGFKNNAAVAGGDATVHDLGQVKEF